MAEQKAPNTPHTLVLENRKALTATGVSNVDSFDEQAVVAYTDLGELVIRGFGLHIDRLNMETGELTLSGDIVSMTYSDNRPAGGFFSRLLK